MKLRKAKHRAKAKQGWAGLRLSVALTLILILSGCAGSLESTQKSMEHSLNTGNSLRAVQVGEDWLKKNADDTKALSKAYFVYETLADFYETEQPDETKALLILEQGSKNTADSRLSSRWINLLLKEEGGAQALLKVFPTSSEILLDGRPFADWTPKELWNWLAVEEDSYGSGTLGDADWYRGESYRNGSINISYYKSEWSESLDVDFYGWDSYSNSRPTEGYVPVMMRQIQPKDSAQAVLAKLGLPKKMQDCFQKGDSMSFTLREGEANVWLDHISQSDSSYLSIQYDTRDYYGSLSFDFYDDKLIGYHITHQMS